MGKKSIKKTWKHDKQPQNIDGKLHWMEAELLLLPEPVNWSLPPMARQQTLLQYTGAMGGSYAGIVVLL